MKKIIIWGLLCLSILTLSGCQQPEKNLPPEAEQNIFSLLMEAEDLSGMAEKTKAVIEQDGSLGLPTEYKGVQISYKSRNPEIITNDGVVTMPSVCWIESRDQQGEHPEDFIGLNDNWPVVLDVTLEFLGQTRTARLLFVVTPRDGFTCEKYLG